MPSFVPLTSQRDRILITIAEARESGRLPRDSFGVEQRDGQLRISAPEELSVEGDIQDLFPIESAGYLSVRRIDSSGPRGPMIVQAVSLTGQGIAYYRWRRLSGPRRVLAELRPTSEEMRKLIYSPAAVGGIAGAITGALSAVVTPHVAEAVSELARRLLGGH